MTKWIFAFSVFLFTCLDGSFSDSFENYNQQIEGTDIKISMNVISSEKDKSISPFWMSSFEITWEQYELFLFRAIDSINQEKKHPEVSVEVDGVSGATTPYIDMSYGMGKGKSPVVNITQYAASTFCKWLSAKTGHFYRLPTEKEWEFACQQGTTQKYTFGDKAKLLKEYAWFDKNSSGQTHPVGEKKANYFDLYDIHGNVAEWIIEPPSSKPNAKPLYPRVAKGGYWKQTDKEMTCSAQLLSDKSWKKLDPQLPKSLWWHTSAPFIGFRIVRPLEVPENYEDWWLKPIEEY